MLIILVISNRLLSSLNPVNFIGLTRRIGWAYLVMILFLMLLDDAPTLVYKKLETRYKKQEGEAPAAPILWPTCRWSSVSWFVVGLKPVAVIYKEDSQCDVRQITPVQILRYRNDKHYFTIFTDLDFN